MIHRLMQAIHRLTSRWCREQCACSYAGQQVGYWHARDTAGEWHEPSEVP